MDFSSAPAMMESPTYSTSSSSSPTSKSAPVTTTIYLSTYTTANTYSSASSLSSLSSTTMSGIPTLSTYSSASSVSSTLMTSVTTSTYNTVAPPAPTTKPTYWGWACNSTNGTLPEQYSSQSGLGCSETFVVPSSTKISINLTEPTATGNDNSTEPTRTFTPGVFPGAAPRGVDTAYAGIAGWTGLMLMVGVWIGLI